VPLTHKKNRTIQRRESRNSVARPSTPCPHLGTVPPPPSPQYFSTALEILIVLELTDCSLSAKAANSLKTFSDHLRPLIDEIGQKEALVKEGANMATMQRIKGTVGVSVCYPRAIRVLTSNRPITKPPKARRSGERFERTIFQYR
jgi:hypothetical protein